MGNIIDKIKISGTSYDLKDKDAPGISGVTQAQYDALPESAKTSNTLFVITDAEAGDLSQYWTSAQTQSAITQAVSGKQDTLVSGTNIKTINNTSILGSGNINIQGGGKAIEAGRGISITTGETADTVSFNLPISAGTSTGSIIECFSYNISSGEYSHAEGFGTTAIATGAHAEGSSTQAKGSCSHAEGQGTIVNNVSEHGCGQYNVSNKKTAFFGDSGNTLFSVGNGTSVSTKHNAFEIRQNGDIYIPYAGNDIKLQDKIAEFQNVISDWVQTMIGVEYIQSTDGYQYINLGYVPSGTGVEIGGEIMIVSYPSTAQWMTTAYIAYTGENYEAFRMIRRSNEDGTLYCNHHTKASGQGQAITMTLGDKYTFKFTDSEYQFGEDTYTNSGGTGTTNTTAIKLFGNGSAQGAISRIYSFYIKKDNALVMDLIPVVKNGVGMMYDKISGQFFSNNGTGSFAFPS